MKEFALKEIKNKRILGRNVCDAGMTDKPLALFWGASALELNIKAKNLWVKFSSDYDVYESWVAIEVNGYQTSRFVVPKGEPVWICVASNLNPQKENLISIIKDTQPMPGDSKHSLLIHKLGFMEEGEFCPLAPRPLKIEFVGDSITSGEGLAGCPEEMDWIPQWFCASKTYARQIAKELNADWSMVSQCGWGICWGWDGNRNSVIPPHYNNVCSVLTGEYQSSLGVNEAFDFKDGADIVVVNLGTNDNGAFSQAPWKDDKGIEYPLKKVSENQADEESSKIIKDEVCNFLKNIRLKNPKAKIIWVWGMIKLNIVPKILEEAVAEYKKITSDFDVHLMELDSMEDVEVNSCDKGSRGHPGLKVHSLAAKKVLEFVKKGVISD